MRILEIGCGEAGVLKAFINRGCLGVGVEFDQSRIDNATIWLEEDILEGKIKLISKDIYDTSPDELGLFNIIILKDVIEHIHNQQKLIAFLKTFLQSEGVIYFGFPPWQMPFGGHQQICKNKTISKLPYYHMLPRYIYRGILKICGENIAEMMEIRDTRISIERFEKIVRNEKFIILAKQLYLINPIYEWKFGWKPRKQFRLLSKIPVVRNFFTTCAYYLIQ